MQKAHLENWLVYTSDAARLYGQVFLHPRFADGEWVITSPIVKQFKNGKVKTRNTVYTLGAPAPRANAS